MEFMPTVFAKGKNIASYGIRVVTWSRFSHCGALHYGDLWHDGVFYSGIKVIESVAFKGVVVTPWDEFLIRYGADRISFGLLPCLFSLQLSYEELIQQLGKRYDYSMNAGVFFRTGWDKSDAWSCSELLAHCSGIYRQDRVSRITPENIFMNSQDWIADKRRPIYAPAIELVVK